MLLRELRKKEVQGLPVHRRCSTWYEIKAVPEVHDWRTETVARGGVNRFQDGAEAGAGDAADTVHFEGVFWV
jgi:hypothetical protein